MSSPTASQSAGLILRDYKPGDEISINAGFNRIFRKDRTLREWEWKFGTAAESSRIMVAVDTVADDRVMVHYGGRELRIWFQGREVRGGHVMDSFAHREPTVVHERWFERVREAFLEKYGQSGMWPVIFGFPGMRAFKHGKLTDHFLNAFPLKVWRAPSTMPHAAHGSLKVSDGIPGTAADELWERTRANYALSVVRDFSWLEHRFVRRPMRGSSYVILSVKRRWSIGGPPAAWGVFLRRKDGRVLWVDCLWDSAHPEHLLALWRKAATLLQPSKPLELWEGPDPRLSQALSRWGWEERAWQSGPLFSYRAYPPLTFEMLDKTPFYITAADTDLV